MADSLLAALRLVSARKEHALPLLFVRFVLDHLPRFGVILIPLLALADF
jgi:hypothetical protein